MILRDYQNDIVDAVKPGVEIRFVKGRIKFSGTTGAGKFPSMVVIFRAGYKSLY